jgi:hypothetical protein
MKTFMKFNQGISNQLKYSTVCHPTIQTTIGFMKMKHILLLLCTFFTTQIFSDTVTIKDDSKVYENVKTRIGRETVEIATKEGKGYIIPKKKIAKIKIEPVEWKSDLSFNHDEMNRVFQETINYTQMLEEELNKNKEELKTSQENYSKMESRIVDLENQAYRYNPYHWRSAAKSLIIPGWGQYSDGHTTKGIAFLTAFGVANVAASVSRHFYDRKVESFNNDLLYPYSIAYYDGGTAGWYSFLYFGEKNREVDAVMNRYNLFQRAVTGIWVLAVLDALFYSPPDSPSTDPKSSMRISDWKLDVSFEPSRNASTNQSENKTNFQFTRSF